MKTLKKRARRGGVTIQAYTCACWNCTICGCGCSCVAGDPAAITRLNDADTKARSQQKNYNALGLNYN